MPETENNTAFKPNRILSGFLTPLFMRTPITPNQITSMSLGTGIIAGFFFSNGSYLSSVAGALTFQLSNILDNCDGDIARAKNMKSVFGGWYDIVSDLLTDICLFGGIAAGLLNTKSSGPVVLACTLCISGSFFHYLIVVMEKIKGFGPAVFAQPHPEGVKRKSFLYKIKEALSEGEASWLVLIFSVCHQIQFILWFGTIYMQIIWISELFMNFRWIFFPVPERKIQ